MTGGSLPARTGSGSGLAPATWLDTAGRSMEFDNSFEVPLPPAEAWKVLLDIERIAPCMPGAQLTEVLDQRTYKGNIAVRLGPVALTSAGIGKVEEIDNTNHKAPISAQGNDAN